MTHAVYRRKAILSRIHKALDAFYLLQKIDWEYDVTATIEKIMGLALEEVEFEGGKAIERALLIVQTPEGGDLEVKAGWKVEEPDLSFSRTVVQQTIERGEPILCENAKDDPRFMEAESIKQLETLSLISTPLRFDEQPIGAFYIESKSPGKVFEPEDLEFLTEFTETIAPYLKVALTHLNHVREIRKLQQEVSDRYSLGNIIGRSESIRNVFDLVRIATGVDRTVLITGESGCGKELIAKAIHYNGHRRLGKFVVVDCSSLSEHLLESELFGHKKGSFTGASHDKVGAFEEASGGTLFLDEISDASKAMQQKLRRVLQEGEIRRVGDNRVRRVDVRVICATNQELLELVQKGEFIRDLYYRINKFPIYIPPLRERREDIPLLVRYFLGRIEQAGASQPPAGITPEALEMLVARDWRENNIRELRNVVELSADFAQGRMIDCAILRRVLRVQKSAGRSTAERSDEPLAAGSFPGLVQVHRERFHDLLDGGEPGPDGSRGRSPFYLLEAEFSARVIVEGLRASAWKLRPAARRLGISPMKLRGELKEFLRRTLEECAGNVQEAARRLDMPVRVLVKKAADLGLHEHVQS